MREASRKNKLFITIIIALTIGSFAYLFTINNVEARRGCCSWHGGVCGCRCCDGTPLSSTCLPYYPECGGGLYDPSPYDYPSYTPNIPDCPLHSYYDSISGSCKCYSGYVASGGKCVSANQWCQDKYGLWATYDSLTDSCKCMSGYIFGKDFLGNVTCVSADQYCRDKYGFNARYNTLTDSCECAYGYLLWGGKCISENDYCQELYGVNAKYDSLADKCVCKKGYIVDPTKTKCINGDTYCRSQYGIHSKYNYWKEKCECEPGYIFFNNKCVDADTYCQKLYGSHSNYNSFAKVCECDYGYKLKDNQCVTPEVFKVFPLKAETGEKITIIGEHFGNSKYGDLKLYVGPIKVNTLDISKWTDDKIVFEVGDYLESGYIYLRGDEVNIRSSYLEILELVSDETGEFDHIFSLQKTVEQKEEPQHLEGTATQPGLKPLPPEELQTEPKPTIEKTKTPKSQEESKEQQDELEKPEEKKEQKKPALMFLASIFNAITNSFNAITNPFKGLFSDYPAYLVD